MTNVRYIEAPTDYRHAEGDPPALFPAGGIPNVRPWHDDVMMLLEIIGKPVVVLCPRRREFPIGDPVVGRLQVAWEHRHLHMATVTMFWFAAPDPDGPVPTEFVVQPTTLLELGVALGEGRPIVVGVDPEYPRPDILEYQLEHYPHITLHHSLRETVLAAVQLLDQPPAEPEPVADVRTKLTGLSRMNTRALEELLTDDEKRRVKIGATIAVFYMSVEEAGLLVGAAQQRAKDRNAHPYKSLHAVLRRLAEAGDNRG